MALAQTFDVTRNLSGLAGIGNINREQEDRPQEEHIEKRTVPKEEKKKVVKEESIKEVQHKETSSLQEILSPVKKKELKTRHKNFLMSEKHYTAFKELAQSRGQSENALFNDILVQLFGE